MDNDVFQHVNNVNYFSFFDTAVTYFEMTEKVVGLLDGPVHCVVAEVACRYHASAGVSGPRHGRHPGRRGSAAVRFATRSAYSATTMTWPRRRAISFMSSWSAACSGRCRFRTTRGRNWDCF